MRFIFEVRQAWQDAVHPNKNLNRKSALISRESNAKNSLVIAGSHGVFSKSRLPVKVARLAGNWRARSRCHK